MVGSRRVDHEVRVSANPSGKMGTNAMETRVSVSATLVVGQVSSNPNNASPEKDKVCHFSDPPSHAWVPIPCIDLLGSYADKKAYSLHSNAIIGEL